MDESACLSEQLKGNKFLFYSDGPPGKNIHGDEHRQTACLGKTLRRNNVP